MKYLIFAVTVIFGILGFIFVLLDNLICLLFFVLMLVSSLFLLIPDYFKRQQQIKKKHQRGECCPDCGGELIAKNDLWINDEEWGILENHMCVKCGKGVENGKRMGDKYVDDVQQRRW